MPADSGKKLFVGPRFRRIRQQLGLSQTQIAEGLGISPSYINLIERNQRPVTAQILLRLAESYDLDLRDLATADEDRFFAELNEIFSDPAVPPDRAAEAGAARPRRALPRRHPRPAAALRGLYRGAARRDPGRRADGRSRRRRPLRGQSDRAGARPDRGQPQLFSGAGNGGGKSARRVECARRRAVRRALGASARKAFDRHPHHAGRRDARDLAAVRPPSPATPDLRTRRRARPRVPARLSDRADRSGEPSRGDHRPRRPARRRAAPALPHLRWRTISPAP